MRQGSTVSFLHGDHLGSASMTTNNAGAKTSEARYMPYGEMRYQWSSTPTDKRFTSHYLKPSYNFLDGKAYSCRN